MPHAVDQEVSMLLRPPYFQLQYSPEEQRTRTMEQAASKRKQDYRSAAFSWFSWEGNSIDKVVKRNSPPAPESPISSNYKIKKDKKYNDFGLSRSRHEYSFAIFSGRRSRSKSIFLRSGQPSATKLGTSSIATTAE